MLGKLGIFAFVLVSISTFTAHTAFAQLQDIPLGSALSRAASSLTEARTTSEESSDAADLRGAVTAEVSSKNLEDLQEFRNCVQYEFCSVNTSNFSKIGDLFVLKTGKFSARQLSQMVNHCPIGDFKAKVEFKDETGNLVVTPASTGANFDAYYAKRAVQYLNATSVSSIRANAGTINQLIGEHRNEEALASDVDHAGLDTLGYKVIYDPSSNFAGAVTTHETKEIRFGKATFQGLEACQLTRILRHEIDHVHQIAMAKACETQGAPSELNDHVQRELSAHLNDALNVGKYCASASWSREHVKFLVGVAKDYIRQMNA
jgi:hypothetical protein